VTEKRDYRWIRGEIRKRDRSLPEEEKKSELPRVESLRKWLLDEANKQRLEDYLDWYLTRYEGRQFEWFSSQAKGQRFTSFHVLAAESLSVKVPSTAVRWLLEPDEGRNDLLDKVHQSLAPGANALWTCDHSLLVGDRKDLASSGALFRLYYNLRTLGTYDLTRGGIGRVTTSKLLAAMFPAVVPIRDSMVETLLGLGDGDNWWLTVRELLLNDGGSLVQLLGGLRIPEGSGDVTSLRRLDIILWMEANAHGLTPKGQRKSSWQPME